MRTFFLTALVPNQAARCRLMAPGSGIALGLDGKVKQRTTSAATRPKVRAAALHRSLATSTPLLSLSSSLLFCSVSTPITRQAR
jgi:hypothetical protein